MAIKISCIALHCGIMLSRAFAADPIKIGVFLPLSGPNTAIGQVQKNAVLMQPLESTVSVVLKTERLNSYWQTPGARRRGGRAAIIKLIQQDRVLVISGGVSSSATWAASAIAQRNNIPFVVTSAAADKIIEQHKLPTFLVQWINGKQ